ncbi:unnamed protein product, partial [Symbiodinium necroappetens]
SALHGVAADSVRREHAPDTPCDPVGSLLPGRLQRDLPPDTRQIEVFETVASGRDRFWRAGSSGEERSLGLHRPRLPAVASTCPTRPSRRCRGGVQPKAWRGRVPFCSH